MRRVTGFSHEGGMKGIMVPTRMIDEQKTQVKRFERV